MRTKNEPNTQSIKGNQNHQSIHNGHTQINICSYPPEADRSGFMDRTLRKSTAFEMMRRFYKILDKADHKDYELKEPSFIQEKLRFNHVEHFKLLFDDSNTHGNVEVVNRVLQDFPDSESAISSIQGLYVSSKIENPSFSSDEILLNLKNQLTERIYEDPDASTAPWTIEQTEQFSTALLYICTEKCKILKPAPTN